MSASDIAGLKIQIVYEDGRAEARETHQLSNAMCDAVEDLLVTLATGERPPRDGIYDLCALAFGTTREDAKLRLTGAAYGKRGKPVT